MKAEVKKCWGTVAHAVVWLFLLVATSVLFSYLKNASFKKNEKRVGK